MSEELDIIESQETVEPEETTLGELGKVYDEIEAKESRARDELGRFVPKQPSTPEVSDVQPDATVQATQQEKPIVDLNQLGYTKAEQEKLAALPDDVLAVLVERNNRFHQGLQPLKQKAEIADSFMGALQPHADYLKALEVAPEDFISSMLSAEKTLRLGNEQQKVNMLQRLAHDYQVPIEKLAETQFDPNLARLQQELEYRDRYINNLRRSQQASETSQIEAQVMQWAQGKEHFDTLREGMANLLNAGMATDLDDAYDKAMRLNDRLYEQQQRQRQAVLADQTARKALGASVQVRNNANTGQNLPVFQSPLDELRYTAEQMGLN